MVMRNTLRKDSVQIGDFLIMSLRRKELLKNYYSELCGFEYKDGWLNGIDWTIKIIKRYIYYSRKKP